MKLLNRTISIYLFYSIIILLVTIPLFYVVVKRVLLRSVDRSLRSQMREIRSNLSSIHSAEEFEVWGRMDKDIRIVPAVQNHRDSIYTILYPDHRRHDMDPYREIAGNITVNDRLYTLVINSSLVENEDLLGSILLVQSVLLVLLMAGMLWINQVSSKKLWRPFYTALNAMKQYELATNSTMHFDKTSIDEFNELNSAAKYLAEKNHETYQAQKEFTENAAHEMQTPVAIFQGKIELLMQTEPLSEEQALLLGEMEEVTLRLSKLNKSLLLLSKIENHQFSQTESINLNTLVSKILEQLKGNADVRGIKITENYWEEMTIEANKTLIEMLFSNLILNAIRHNRELGEIVVLINNSVLTIKNTGAGEALPSDKIFERFYKSGQQSASIGLGLAIVKKICDLGHFSISYSFDQGWHQFNFSAGGR